MLCIALAVLLAAGAAGIYLEGSARVAENPQESIYTAESAAGRLAPAVPLFIAAAALAVLGIALGVKDPEAGKPAKAGGRTAPKAEWKHAGVIRAAVVVAAAAFILAGVLNGSARDVLVKAIHICTECVGLG